MTLFFLLGGWVIFMTLLTASWVKLHRRHRLRMERLDIAKMYNDRAGKYIECMKNCRTLEELEPFERQAKECLALSEQIRKSLDEIK